MSLDEITDLANYLLSRMQKKEDLHFATSISKCSLLSLRRDVSIMDEAYTEYLPRVLTMCTTEKHVVRLENLTLELPRLFRCGDALILPKLMLLKENIKSHVIEALLAAALLSSEIQLHYLSKNVDGDIEEGLSITIKPEWGKELLNAVIDSLRNREVRVKTINCNICPLRNICPFSNLGDEIVLPSETSKIVNEIYNSIFMQPTNAQEAHDENKLVPPSTTDREAIRDYLKRVASWAREQGRTWVRVAVGKCPICGRDGTLVIRIVGSNGEKVLYRHGSSTCTVGTIDESVDRLNIKRFLEIEH
ncbi:hypothetical protein [Vulcanisaeta souniana]|uniref:Uncharacterized protein n=1 Tax=Vulcanisaeta souniana JCM 11219 TaxID=1293586 RepID=A0A830E3S5_9CREN|nr:hypothetical protein [Vulcanisaeta souniana]BDR93567.1 hypothetical protein Vsou_26600 [Vulcanisaeta souniana JCM 11219]GGI79146.1 hypothetical protein GCM10007112_15160 [Vulcanisaeta souniana JCM 11219]